MFDISVITRVQMESISTQPRESIEFYAGAKLRYKVVVNPDSHLGINLTALGQAAVLVYQKGWS